MVRSGQDVRRYNSRDQPRPSTSKATAPVDPPHRKPELDLLFFAAKGTIDKGQAGGAEWRSTWKHWNGLSPRWWQLGAREQRKALAMRLLAMSQPRPRRAWGIRHRHPKSLLEADVASGARRGPATSDAEQVEAHAPVTEVEAREP